MAWAIAASAAMHLWIAEGVPPDARRVPATPLPAPMLAARLVHVETAREATDAVAGTAAVEAIEKVPDAAPHQRSPRLPLSRADSQVDERPKAPIEDALRQEPNRALPALTDPVYYPARELDIYPSPFVPLSFGYPAHLVHTQLAGSVLLSVKVDEAGAVDETAVISADPPGHFEDHTRAVLAAARFNPARRAGRPVRSQVTVRVEYDPAMREGAMR